jgi:type IV secretory pathway VirB2 component (pilin)
MPQQRHRHFSLPGTVAVLAVCLCFALSQGALAQNVFGVATTQANDIFGAARTILEGIGLLGALGVAAMAMTGRMPWGWAFAVMGALLLIKMAPGLQSWVQQMASAGTGGNNAQGVAETIKTASKMHLYQDGRIILYVFSGIAIVCLAILSMFGRFQWKWLAAVIVGIIILDWSESIISEFTGDGTMSQSAIGDSLIETETLADRTARQGQYIIYGIGGVAILGLASMAMMGRFSWNWFFAVTGGLLLIASVNFGLQYISGEGDLLQNQWTR